MTKRGKVLRDPYAGPGLVMAEGRQYLFVCEGVWKSDAPPRPGLVVDLDLDENGEVRAIHVVSEAQLAHERGESAPRGRKTGSPVFTSRFGILTVLATVVVAAAWWFLTAFAVQSPLFGQLGFTFWQGLGLLDSSSVLEMLDQHGSPGPGLYGALSVLALTGPFLQFFWKDRIAILAGVVPLLSTGVFEAAIYSTLKNAVGTPPTLGLGSLTAVAGSIFLALLAAKQFTVSKPIGAPKSQDLREAA